MALGILSIGITLVPVYLSFAKILLPENSNLTSAIKQGESLIGEFNENGDPKELRRAWNLSKLWLTAEKNTNHFVIEVKPGYYENAQTIILKKMAQILENPKIPSEVKGEIEVFYKNKSSLQEFLKADEEKRTEIIQKSLPFLASAEGFKWFDDMGSIYSRDGNCEKVFVINNLDGIIN